MIGFIDSNGQLGLKSIPNEVCPKCGHHALDHVIFGPKGHGCQVMIGGEHERGTCGCTNYTPLDPAGPLIGVWEVYKDE